MWQYGKKFDNDKYKILFVGKVAIGVVETENQKYYNHADNLIKENHSPFWNYTKAIIDELGIEWENVCMTNLVKCDFGSTADTTTQAMMENCIRTHRFIKNEIEEIKPKHIIFYTARGYDTFIRTEGDNNIFDKIEILEDTDKKCGAKTIPYLRFNATINGNKYYCLRVGHPERKKKKDFVKIITDFIREEKI